MLLGWAIAGFGAGIIGGQLVLLTQPAAPWAAPVATALLWLGMLVPVIIALTRSRPVGLLRFRPTDLVIGAGFGVLLRFAQGAIEQAVDGHAAIPGIVLIDGRIPAGWWLTEALPAVVVAPALEEFFFRVVVLVAIYAMLRRPFGPVAAGLAALFVSTGLFVAAHLVSGVVTVPGVLALTAVGVVCAGLVLLTGRIWSAVLAHVVYNAIAIALAVAGALTS